jgi:HAD superfamily hydrolase (TIGR01509 family)
VFDLDGTMVDNMPWHTRAFEAFVARHGLPPVTLELRRRIDGKRNREIFPLLFEREMAADEIRAFEDEKEGAYREMSRAALTPMAGLLRLLDRFDAHAIPVAVATSAPESNVVHTLREIGLHARIATIARGDQVPLGKPAPDVFLHAASLLGVAPEACLAFEDAPLGVASARRAGMMCVALTSSFTPESFAASDIPPHATYADFDAFLAGDGAWLLEPAGMAAPVPATFRS